MLKQRVWYRTPESVSLFADQLSKVPVQPAFTTAALLVLGAISCSQISIVVIMSRKVVSP